MLVLPSGVVDVGALLFSFISGPRLFERRKPLWRSVNP